MKKILTLGLSKRILPSTVGLRIVHSKSPIVVCLASFALPENSAWNFSGIWAGRCLDPSSVSCFTILVLGNKNEQ